MTSPELLKRWKITRVHLERACRMLPSPSPDHADTFERLFSDYKSYLDRNELELALDMLVDLGDMVPCQGGYWRNLERAADAMELNYRIPYLRQRFEQSLKDKLNERG